MNAEERVALNRVRELIQSKGPRLLEAVGERASSSAEWVIHSHGAMLKVESPHPGIFDQLVLALPRPAERTPEDFKTWAEGRISRLDKYLERTNLGRVVKQVSAETCMIVSVARRVGHDPGDARGYFPPPEDLPKLMQGFVQTLEAYVRIIGDGGLRYVGGLRLFILPRGAEPPEWKLGLDVMDTVIGRREETDNLAPLTLVRGVLTELAAIAEVRALVFEGTRAERKARNRATAHYCQALLDLAERAGQPGFMLSHVTRLLGEIPPPPSPRLPVPALIGLGVLLVGALWFWFS